jgi:hypothetical protein
VPVLWCDAGSRESAKSVVITLLEYALEPAASRARSAAPGRAFVNMTAPPSDSNCSTMGAA